MNRVQGERVEIHTCPELMEYVQQVGFLPLLEGGIPGYAAESLMAEECRFTEFPDGSWEWKVLCRKGWFHQQSVVARLLQLAAYHSSCAGRRKHRGDHPKHIT